MRKSLMTATATLAWLTLGFLLYVTIENTIAGGWPAIEGLRTYLSFFTILSNIFAAIILSLSLLQPDSKSFLVRPTIMSAATVYVVTCGLLYELSLKGFWKPQGELQVLADTLLHDVAPLLYVLYWLMFVPKGMLRWIHSILWLIFPFVYVTSILFSGALSGVYPYPSFDVNARGYGRVLTGALVFLVVIFALGLIAIAVDRWIMRKRHQTMKL